MAGRKKAETESRKNRTATKKLEEEELPRSTLTLEYTWFVSTDKLPFLDIYMKEKITVV